MRSNHICRAFTEKTKPVQRDRCDQKHCQSTAPRLLQQQEHLHSRTRQIPCIVIAHRFQQLLSSRMVLITLHPAAHAVASSAAAASTAAAAGCPQHNKSIPSWRSPLHTPALGPYPLHNHPALVQSQHCKEGIPVTSQHPSNIPVTLRRRHVAMLNPRSWQAKWMLGALSTYQGPPEPSRCG
jgi:hypothetical protein